MTSHHVEQNVVEALTEEEGRFVVTSRLRCETRPLLMMRITLLCWNAMCVLIFMHSTV